MQSLYRREDPEEQQRNSPQGMKLFSRLKGIVDSDEDSDSD